MSVLHKPSNTRPGLGDLSDPPGKYRPGKLMKVGLGFRGLGSRLVCLEQGCVNRLQKFKQDSPCLVSEELLAIMTTFRTSSKVS